MGTGGWAAVLGGILGLAGIRLAGKLGARQSIGEKVGPRKEEIQVSED